MQVSEREAVERVIRDYIEAWYTGDEAKMDRSLHDGLSKRTLADEEPAGSLREVPKERMVALTGDGAGLDAAGLIEVAVYDVSGDIASGSVLSNDYLDYVHLARTADGWQITNIMFAERAG